MKQLDDLQALIDALKDPAKQVARYEALHGFTNQALADIARYLENMPQPAPPPDLQSVAAAIVQGIGGMKFPAPAVTVQAPAGKDWKSLKVVAMRDGMGRPTGEMTITKVYE